MERFRKPSGVFGDRLLHLSADRGRRINRNAVAGMHARPLDMLHDSRNENVRAIADRVHLQLLAL